MKWTPERRMGAIALGLLVLDQLTKWLVIHRLYLGDEIRVLPGFFNLVHWGNTGAAWSLFHGNNHVLATVSAVALVVLYLARRYFEGDTLPGQIALGLIFGGITGNLIDRAFSARGVVDFIGPYDLKFMRWPVFNFADVWVVTGTLAFAIVAARPQTKPGEPVQEQVL